MYITAPGAAGPGVLGPGRPHTAGDPGSVRARRGHGHRTRRALRPRPTDDLKHLKVLERAGLVSRSREAHFRPVHLQAAPLRAASEWLGDYRQFWERSLDQLDALLRELKDHEETP